MKNTDLTRKIVVHSLLIALTVVFTLISNNVVIAGVSINLSLITIAIAAIIYGPISGMIVGFVNGGMVMLSAAPFFAINPVATVFICLLKSGLAGVFAGIIYHIFDKAHKNNRVGVCIASISVPLVNTSIFIIGSLLFFGGVIGELITIFIGVNFIVEFLISLFLTPTIFYIVTIFKNKRLAK